MQKRKHDETEALIEVKRTQSKPIKFDKSKCSIPGCKEETAEKEPLHDEMSKQLNVCFCEYALSISGGDLAVLGKISQHMWNYVLKLSN